MAEKEEKAVAVLEVSESDDKSKKEKEEEEDMGVFFIDRLLKMINRAIDDDERDDEYLVLVTSLFGLGDDFTEMVYYYEEELLMRKINRKDIDVYGARYPLPGFITFQHIFGEFTLEIKKIRSYGRDYEQTLSILTVNWEKEMKYWFEVTLKRLPGPKDQLKLTSSLRGLRVKKGKEADAFLATDHFDVRDECTKLLRIFKKQQTAYTPGVKLWGSEVHAIILLVVDRHINKAFHEERPMLEHTLVDFLRRGVDVVHDVNKLIELAQGNAEGDVEDFINDTIEELEFAIYKAELFTVKDRPKITEETPAKLEEYEKAKPKEPPKVVLPRRPSNQP